MPLAIDMPAQYNHLSILYVLIHLVANGVVCGRSSPGCSQLVHKSDRHTANFTIADNITRKRTGIKLPEG